jgi:hypothetical protein
MTQSIRHLLTCLRPGALLACESPNPTGPCEPA